MQSVCVLKTKHVVTGRLVEVCDQKLISLKGGRQCMDGSLILYPCMITQSRRIDAEVNRQLVPSSNFKFFAYMVP